MEIKEYSSERFEELEQEWKQLEFGAEMTAFQHYDWYKCINDLYKKEIAKKPFRKWIYLLVKDNDRPIMIAPIQIIKTGIQIKNIGISRGAYLIGRQEGYTDYLNFIYKDFSEDAVRVIISHLKIVHKLNRVCFERLLETTSLYKYVINTYQFDQSECYCAALELPSTFDEYKKKLSKNSRQNIRTAINRQKRNELVLTHEIVYELDAKTKDTLKSIRKQRLNEKKKKSLQKASIKGKVYSKCRNMIISLFDAKHDVIEGASNPWCFLVKNGDRIVSFFWGIKNNYRDEYYVILAGVDKDFTWYSPSLSHLYLFIQEQYESNKMIIKTIDFTRGSERYKEDMGASKKSAWAITFKI